MSKVKVFPFAFLLSSIFSLFLIEPFVFSVVD